MTAQAPISSARVACRPPCTMPGAPSHPGRAVKVVVTALSPSRSNCSCHADRVGGAAAEAGLVCAEQFARVEVGHAGAGSAAGIGWPAAAGGAHPARCCRRRRATMRTQHGHRWRPFEHGVDGGDVVEARHQLCEGLRDLRVQLGRDDPLGGALVDRQPGWRETQPRAALRGCRRRVRPQMARASSTRPAKAYTMPRLSWW